MRAGKNSIIIFLILAALLTACDGLAGILADWPPVTSDESPPFVITRPVFEIYARPNCFTYAGMIFNFLNKTQENIDSITVSFMLFGAETRDRSVFGGKKFEIVKLEPVLPGENKELIISIDRFIYIAPTEPYIIDMFYISEIHYANGSVWKDTYGKYMVRW